MALTPASASPQWLTSTSSDATPLTPEERKAKEAFAQMVWTSGIVGFFAIQAMIWAVAITLTHNDPSHAVVADLDERVGSWDQRQAALAASDRLGWTVQIVVDPKMDSFGQRGVEVRVVDRTGQAVPIESVRLQGFHRARIAEKQEIELNPVGPGLWRGTAKLRQSGWWRFEGTAERAEDQRWIREELFCSFAEGN
jgi:nitrogen fixation protein FixH